MRFPNIDAERVRHGLSKAEFARRLGVTQKTPSNWEKTGNIPLRSLLRMADMFGVTIDYLVEPGQDEKEESA